jgi:hypothetical protein
MVTSLAFIVLVVSQSIMYSFSDVASKIKQNNLKKEAAIRYIPETISNISQI